MQLATTKGRGARTNASGRFEPVVHEVFDDGWTAEDETPAPLRTTLTPEHARTIITKNIHRQASRPNHRFSLAPPAMVCSRVLTAKDRKMPNTIANCCSEPNLPRIRGGDVSAM